MISDIYSYAGHHFNCTRLCCVYAPIENGAALPVITENKNSAEQKWKGLKWTVTGTERERKNGFIYTNRPVQIKTVFCLYLDYWRCSKPKRSVFVKQPA